jgi:Heterokaryon incompatibility protein (HET)
MLRRLRSPDTSQLVWVDAVCIDQDNIDECNTQVVMMGQIHQTANGVLIDIGEKSDSSGEALEAITYCSEEALYSMRFGLPTRDILSELYDRPLFSRIWVLQEAFRSKEAVVMCGTDCIPWSTFTPFRIWVNSRPAGETEHWHVELPGIVLMF